MAKKSVASIAKQALDKVSAKLDNVIRAAVVSRLATGSTNPTFDEDVDDYVVGSVKIMGGAGVTLAGAGHVLTLTGASFIAAGFLVGQTVKTRWIVAATGQTFTVTGVAALALTLTETVPSFPAEDDFAVYAIAAPQSETQTGRVVIESRQKLISQYLAGTEILPTDDVLFVEGLTVFVPREGDTIALDGGQPRRIVFVDDVVGAHEAYVMVAR